MIKIKDKEYLTPKETAEMIGRKVSTLEKWRHLGIKLSYIKFR